MLRVLVVRSVVVVGEVDENTNFVRLGRFVVVSALAGDRFVVVHRGRFNVGGGCRFGDARVDVSAVACRGYVVCV